MHFILREKHARKNAGCDKGYAGLTALTSPDSGSKFHVPSAQEYFNSINKGINVTLPVRGGKEINAMVNSARLKVTAHGKKRFVIALKYEDESNYRYLVATDMTWRTMDIIKPTP